MSANAAASPGPLFAPDARRRTLFILLCVLVFFFTGGHVVQSLVNYPTWGLIDPASFPAFHHSMAIRAAFFLMIPRLLEILLATAILVWFLPRTVSRGMMRLALSLAVAAFFITVMWARPTHAELGVAGNTPELLARLRLIDLSRLGLEVIRAAIYLGLLLRLINPPR